MQHTVATLFVVTFVVSCGLANHHNDNSVNTFYLRKIFAKYSEGDSLSLDGFLTMISESPAGWDFSDKGTKPRRNQSVGVIQDPKKDADSGPNKQCLRDTDFFNFITGDGASTLDSNLLEEKCPMILYHFLARSEFEKENGCIYVPQHEDAQPDATFAFIGAISAILLIGFCGFLGILLVPYAHQNFYTPTMQGLVGLSIGTVIGDSCMHLLPYAFGTGKGATHLEKCVKGLCISLSIIFFFAMEKTLYILRQRRNQTPPTVNAEAEQRLPSAEEAANIHINGAESNADGDMTSNNITEEIQTQQNQTDASHQEHSDTNEQPKPYSLVSLAWMLLMGDALHNFSDGVAIGAAFSVSLPSGFSTFVAVLCHELPHELGDFAVMMKAGMPLEKAITLNAMSSITGLMGMLVGLLLGRVSNMASWLFTISGGLFLYVALCDMIPELSVKHPTVGPFAMLFIEVTGMVTGTFIIFIISIYEHEMRDLFA